MIQKIIKNIVTVLVIMGCLFVCLIGVAYYLYSMDNLDYELRNTIAMGEIKEAFAVPIGKTYNGKTSEDGSFYDVYVTFKNTGNYPADYMSIDWTFLQSGPGYTDRVVKLSYLFGYPQGAINCVPGGKEGVINRVIELNDDFENVKIIYVDGYTKEEQVIDLEIRER